MPTDYQITLTDPFGIRLATIDRFSKCSYARAENDIGQLTLSMPDIYDRDKFRLDGRILVEKSVAGGPLALDMDAVWLIRDRYEVLSSEGETLWAVDCEDANSLLSNPIIAYNAGSTGVPGALKLLPADDFSKALIRENMGSLASDTTRDLSAYLSVQADSGSAPTLRRDFSRRVILESIKELAEASAEYGTWLGFDIVPSNLLTGGLEFRTYTAQRGNDHRFPGGNPPLLLDVDIGNLADVELRIARREEKTFIYAGGQGIADVRAIATASSPTRIAESPWQRSRELFVNGSSVVEAVELADLAASELQANRPKIIFTARIVETAQALRGVHWDYGDQVTSNFRNKAYDCRVSAVSVTLQSTRSGIADNVDAQLRAETEVGG